MKSKLIVFFIIVLVIGGKILVNADGMHYQSTNGMHYQGGPPPYTVRTKTASETDEERERAERLRQHEKIREDAERKKEKRKEALDKKIRDERDELARIKAAGKKFDQFQDSLNSYKKRVEAADLTNDLIERRRVREELIHKSREKEQFARSFSSRVERWNARSFYDSFYSHRIDHTHKWAVEESKDQANKFQKFKELLKKDLIAIKKDLKNKLRGDEQEIAISKEQVKAADETNDLQERLRVRKEVIRAMAKAARFVEKYIHCFCNWRGHVINKNFSCEGKNLGKIAKTYHDYKYTLEKNLPAIEDDIQRQIDPNYQPKKVKKAKNKKKNKHKNGTRSKLKKAGKILSFNLEEDISTDQVLEGLRDLKAMCSGLSASQIMLFDDFYELLSSFERQESDKELHGDENLHEDEEIKEEYTLDAYSYNDEKNEVYMEFRELFKKPSASKDLELDGLDDTLNLTGLHIEESEDEITFTLTDCGKDMIIKTDLESIENYLKTYTTEVKIGFQEKYKERLAINLENLSLWGVEENELETILPQLVEFISIVGNPYKIGELINYGEKSKNTVSLTNPYIFSVFPDQTVNVTSRFEAQENELETLETVKVKINE